jgi:hypothetical protein
LEELEKEKNDFAVGGWIRSFYGVLMSLLFRRELEKHNIIAVVGLAKNTGKTTTLNRLISNTEVMDKRVGLISTGRDGERFDVFTTRRKPRVIVSAGTFFVSTEQSICACEARVEVCDSTEYITSMGKVLIGKTMSEGAIEISGPATVLQTIDIMTRLLCKYEVDNILIDSSINRMAITTSKIKSGLILATGSVLGSLDEVIEKTKMMVAMMQLESVDSSLEHIIKKNNKKAHALLIRDDYTVHTFNEPLLQCVGGVAEKMTSEVRYLYSDGALTDLLIEDLMKTGIPLTLIVEDFSKIHLSAKSYRKWVACCGGLMVIHKVNLLAVTCNPHNSMGASFEPKMFQNAINDNLDVPVYDVMES